tara:strand:- start:160 stop:621 length:462 start_codon:yes stop_codon:yes gene_type:complete
MYINNKIVNVNMDNEKKTYIIEPKYKKSSFSNEYWINRILNKDVTVVVTVQWRWSVFSINLTDEEKNKLNNLIDINISDYDYEFDNMTDACERFIFIKNENNYTARELKEIYMMIYDNDEEEEYDEEIMEQNNWILEDTTYEISGGFILKEEL